MSESCKCKLCYGIMNVGKCLILYPQLPLASAVSQKEKVFCNFSECCFALNVGECLISMPTTKYKIPMQDTDKHISIYGIQREAVQAPQ